MLAKIALIAFLAGQLAAAAVQVPERREAAPGKVADPLPSYETVEEAYDGPTHDKRARKCGINPINGLPVGEGCRKYLPISPH